MADAGLGSSAVTCGPLWSHECGSSLYSTGICSRVGRNFKLSNTIAPALQRCETFMDIVIVLDGSNSIYPWYEVQDFLINILHKFYIGPGQTQVGVIQYGSSVVHEFTLDEYQTVEDVVDAARRIDQRGGEETRTALGINVARENRIPASGSENDGVLLGAVGAYDWNGAVLKESKHGKVVPPKSSYQDEFPEELKNHAAYLGYSVGSLISSRGSQLYVAGAPRFNHTGKVIIFTLKNSGDLTIWHALLGEQIGSYFGSELLSMDIDSDGQTDVLLVAAPMYYSHGWERGKVYIYSVTPQTSFVLQGVLEVSEHSQNSRLGSALAQVPDMNGDGFKELVVGAPLEDDHQGAVYVFHGKDKTIQLQYRQRLSAAGFSAGLQYFGQSLHGVLDINADGLVDLAVGALGAAVIVWSRGVVQIQAKLTFEPEKVNIFNKDCQRGGKEVTCMSVTVCLSLDFRTKTRTKTRKDVAVWYSLLLDERRFPPRAVLDESDRQQPRSLLLQTGSQKCQRLGFSVQETTDYGRPIVVVLETGLQNPDEGPVLDPDWQSTQRTELHFWNGCEQEDTCVPDLILHSHTDLMSAQQFCRLNRRAASSICSHQGVPEKQPFVVESERRRMVVFARLENQGENAYGAAIHISTSSNLIFSSLLVKDQSDIQIECSSEDRLATRRICNISAPFMKSLSQVTFNVEFEFSRYIFLDYVHVVMVTTSEGDEGYPDDNTNDIFLALKYQTELLFTRDPYPPRFVIRADSSSSSSWDQSDSSSHTFNLSYYIQNLGLFAVQDVLFRADIWAVTTRGNQLLNITDVSIEQAAGSHCTLPHVRMSSPVTPEDLTHLSQLNHSNSVNMEVRCQLNLPPSREVKVTLTGSLQLAALLAVKFRSLELLTAASIQLEASSPAFLQEDRPVRQIILDLRKEEDHSIPIWIIVGSSLGGLLLLALLVLALWKLGFFNRRRRKEEEEQPVANGKTAQEL
ncbi:integrin alpha-11-like [Neolamprologus brichardi]|uniref:integrin alpha-11-like n=1 Tax=Neolamprologus brichardi TaxID=32507 RepID=UPI001643FA37|nr:integrin alpha-11-like [Neolamprologus brichardi]